MTSAVKQTRYAADRDKMVCLLLDIRGRAREHTIQVFSYSKGRIVNLPRRYRNGVRAGQDAIRIETPEAKRWAAVSVPTWLANAEGLYGKPALPPLQTGFTQQFHEDNRTDQEKRDDAERSLAQFVVDRENRYRRLPGQRAGFSKRDYVSARSFQ